MKTKLKNFNPTVIYLFLALALFLLFTLIPLPGGDDWETFYGGARRIIFCEPLYESELTHSYFYNPPWVAVLLVPFSIFPFKISWSLFSVSTLIVSLLLIKKYNGNPSKLAFLVLSPPMFYILLHGQIDMLVLAGLLLPRELWVLLSFSKPQVAISLVFGISRSHWKFAIGLTSIVLIVSFLWFGNWPLEIMRLPTPFILGGHNLWHGIWPLQVPIGIALILLGLEHRDERILIAASPFLLPYAGMSSLIGPWFALSFYLNDRNTALILTSWWLVIFYRVIISGALSAGVY